VTVRSPPKAISRELSRLLRGEIRLVSAPNKGSVFSLYLPQAFPPSRTQRKSTDAAAVATAAIEAARQAAERRLVERTAALDVPVEEARGADAAAAPPVMVNEADDDRDAVHPGDRSVLVVENDLAFARVLLESAREQGFKGIVTTQGTTALTLLNEYHPSAILLDIFLPDIEGWRVLARLKNDITVRHTPVTVISPEEARELAPDSGARRFVAKPLQSRKAVDEVLADVVRAIRRFRPDLIITRFPTSGLEGDSTALTESAPSGVCAAWIPGDQDESAMPAIRNADGKAGHDAIPDVVMRALRCGLFWQSSHQPVS